MFRRLGLFTLIGSPLLFSAQVLTLLALFF